jgi:hypothetical protein
MPEINDIDEWIKCLIALGLLAELARLLVTLANDAIKYRRSQNEIHFVPIKLVTEVRAHENGPLYSGIALIDLNDPNMNLTRTLLGAILSRFKLGLRIMWVHDGQHTRCCLVNLYNLYNENAFHLERTSLYINGDELVRTYLVSLAWPMFLYLSSTFNIILSTGFLLTKLQLLNIPRDLLQLEI